MKKLRAIRGALTTQIKGVLVQKKGTAQSALARIERGDSSPRADTLHRLAEALGIRPAQLMADD